MRQTIKEIEVWRWFIGYSLTEPVPHFSTFGKNYVRRFADSNRADIQKNLEGSSEIWLSGRKYNFYLLT